MKPITEQSLYEILEVRADAPPEEIEIAYQRAKALYGPGSLATYSLAAPEEMALLNRRIEEARSVLLDAAARAGYDAELPGALRAPGPAPFAAPPAAALAPAPGVPSPAAVPAGAGPAAAESPPAGPPGGAVAAQAVGPVTPAAGAAAPAPAPQPAGPAAGGGAAPAPQAAGAAAGGAEAAQPPRPTTAYSAADGTPWTGEVLRRAREGRGLTLHQISQRTKVARHHLENIEADRYELLPALVYLRGILVSLSKELRLDGQKVARSYVQQMEAAAGPKVPAKSR